jgi:hypothetical protein
MVQNMFAVWCATGVFSKFRRAQEREGPKEKTYYILSLC